MSARAPRRSFATPFVLTLAAIPAACTVQSAPPPQGPTQTSATHDHRDEPTPTNPPPVEAQPTSPDMTPVANPPRPAQPAQAGVNDQVKGTASTNANTVAQSKPSVKPGPAPARGYREWTVTRRDGKCESMVKVHCPEGVMCNPPPPAKYACPKQLAADNDHIDVIQRAEKGDCFIDFGEMSCPPDASCNPPPPQKVACPK